MNSLPYKECIASLIRKLFLCNMLSFDFILK